MFEKLPIFITNHPTLVILALAALSIALFLEYRKGGRPITTSELTRLMNDNKATVVDIRAEKDYKAGHINTSIHISADQLLLQKTALTGHVAKKPVIVCATGMQSKASVERLQEAGIDACRLAGGINEWTASNIPLTKS